MGEQPHMWDRLSGQEAVVRVLREAVSRGASGHAYLFAGPDGVGRGLAALALAASLNCPDGGCGSCEACRKILRRAHPDVTVVQPEGAQILVAQVRAIREEAFRSPIEGRVKVFILEEAERMNAAAANALLKVLEEPPSDVLFVLITGAPEDLPPTIVSRCRRLDFSALGPGTVRDVLVGQYGIEPARAEWAARVGGSLPRALRLAKSPEAQARRDAHMALPARLAGAPPAEAVRAAEEVRAEAEAVLERLRKDQRKEADQHAEAFGQARGTAAARKRLEERHKREVRRLELDLYGDVLADLASFYRDALLAASGAGAEALVNGEDADRARRAAFASSPARLIEAVGHVASTRRALSQNVVPNLALEALFMDLAEARVPA